MGTFRDVIPSLTIEECNKIALEQGGSFDSFYYGYDCPKSNPTMNSEYGVKVVNTQGMGNHGFFVLVGRTPKSRELLRQGKIAELMSQFNIPHWFASRTVRASYSFEISGLAYALYDLLASCEHGHAAWLAEELSRAGSHRELKELLDDTYCGDFSFPRYEVAIGHAVKAWKDRHSLSK